MRMNYGENIYHLRRDADVSQEALAKAIGQRSISGRFKLRIAQLMSADFIEYTIPEKPNSRLQKYRLTAKGRAALAR